MYSDLFNIIIFQKIILHLCNILNIIHKRSRTNETDVRRIKKNQSLRKRR